MVATVVPMDGRWTWSMSVNVRNIAPTDGNRNNLTAAQRAAEASWTKWLVYADLA